MTLRFVPALVVLALAGCFPTVDVPVPPRCDDVPGAATVPEPDVQLVQQPASVTLAVRANGCLPVNVTAYAEVDGPDGRRVPSTVDFELEGRVARVTVRFTPVVAGAHTVAAHVEPTVGVARRGVTVARVAPVSVSARIATPCDDEALTASGAWICRAGTTVTAWRDGMQLQAWPATGVEVHGDTVWLLAPGQVERFEDVGRTFLSRVPDAVLPLDTAGTLLARGPDELWQVSPTAARRVQLVDGALELVAERALPPGLCASAPRFRVSEDTPSLWLACASRPGATRLCRFDVPASDVDGCREVAGELVGLEPGALWLRDEVALRHVPLVGAERAAALDSSWSVASTPAGWPSVTSPAGRALVPTLWGAEVLLEAVPTPQPLVSLSRDTIIVGTPLQRVAFRRTP